MLNLGFNQNEINIGEQLYDKDGMYVPKTFKELYGDQMAMAMGPIIKYYISLMHGEYSEFKDNVQYLINNQIQDEIPIEELTNVSKHYQKMYKYFNRGIPPLSMYNFAQFGQNNLKAYVRFRNLTGPFSIYNEGNYELKEYGKKKTIVTTDKCPDAQKKEDLLSKVITIEPDPSQENVYILEVNNSNVGLVNRYAIILALKPPVDHCGCMCIMTSGGNVIYIYALPWNQNDKKRDEKIANAGGQITNKALVLGWGFTTQKLEEDLKKITNFLYQKCDGRLFNIIRPMHEFEEGVEWLGEEELTDEQIENMW